MKHKRFMDIFATALIFIILFMYFYSFPKEIHAKHQALKFIEGDITSVETVTVKIEGTVFRPIFKQYSFEGSLDIDRYEFTKLSVLTMSFFISKKENGVYWGSILYTKGTLPWETKEPVSIFLMRILIR